MVDQETIDRVAAAIESANIGHNLTLIRLVDGEATYRVTIDGRTETFVDNAEADAINQGYEFIRTVKQRKQAEAVIAALSPSPETHLNVKDHTKLDGPELWELTFGILEGDVPEQMTGEVFTKLAEALNNVFVDPLQLAGKLPSPETLPNGVYGPYVPTFIGPAVWAAITDELPAELVDKKVWITTATPANPRMPDDALRTAREIWAETVSPMFASEIRAGVHDESRKITRVVEIIMTERQRHTATPPAQTQMRGSIAALQAWSELKYGQAFSVSACHDLLNVLKDAEASRAPRLEPIAYLRHGEKTPVQNVPWGAMWISDKNDPRAFAVYTEQYLASAMEFRNLAMHWRDALQTVLVEDDLEKAQAVAGDALSNAPKMTGKTDTELLDALRENSWDLRCISVPTGGDDHDIDWVVVEHHQAAPHERTIAQGYRDEPRDAIRRALRETDPDAARCVSCDEILHDGDSVYYEHGEGGHIHSWCTSDDPESFVDEDEAPLKPGNEIPEPFPYSVEKWERPDHG